MRKKIITLATVGALGLGLAACGNDSSDKDDAAPANGSGALSKTLVVAASPVPHAEILKYVKDNLADQAGLKLEVKEFTDYVQPNLATQDGSAGANFFQHKPYLDDFNNEKKTDLVSVTAVHLEPLGVYSKKTKALADIRDGATVAIPNDATNGGRALNLLAGNGLITLKDGAGTAATEKDITANPKNLKFKALEAAQLPRSLDDVDAAVINGNYALDAGLTPSKDALALETAEGNPYANILVAKKGKESDPRVVKLAELLNSNEVKQFIAQKYNGSVVAV